ALLVGIALAASLVRSARPRLMALWAPLAAGYGIAAIVAIPLLAYAVGHFEGVSINRPRDFSVDLLEVLVPTRLIAAGAAWAPGIAARFPGGDAERGAYLGLPLLAIIVLFALRNRRRPGGRFLPAALVLAWFCSLGTALWVAGNGIAPLPWAVVAHVPGFTNVLPARLSLFTALAASVVAALWIRDAPTPLAIVLPALAVLA